MTKVSATILCLLLTATSFSACSGDGSNDGNTPAASETTGTADVNKSVAVVLEATPQTVKEELSEKGEFSPTADDVIGQWRNVVTNPARRNTVTNRYMRHTFSGDGTVIIENKEDSQNSGTWEFIDGTVVVSSSYETSSFAQTYEFRGRDRLAKTRFQRFVDGKRLADYERKDTYIRQGSDLEKNMTVWSLFKKTAMPSEIIGPASQAENQIYALCSAALAYESQSNSGDLMDSYIHLSRVYLNKMDAQHRPAVEAILSKMFSGEIDKSRIDGTVVNCVNALK